MMEELNWLGKYYQFKIAVVGKKYLFVPYRNAMVDSIKKVGVEAKGFNEIDEALLWEPEAIVVICPTLYQLPKSKGNVLWVMVQTEQLYTGHGGKIFGSTHIKQLKPYLKFFDVILDWSSDHIDVLKQATKSKIIWFPHSWIPETEPKGFEKNKEEYDLLFIGNMPGVNKRRLQAIDYLSKYYKVYPIRNDLWEAKKTEAIRDSKICLNIHYEESRSMESPRLYDYFAHKAFVLSEPMNSTYPFTAGKDFVEFFWTEVRKIIDYYLEQESERRSVAEHAYNTAKSVSMDTTIRRLVDEIIILRYEKFV